MLISRVLKHIQRGTFADAVRNRITGQYKENKEAHAWVNTSEVHYILWNSDLPKDLKNLNSLTVVDGDWDFAKIKFESTPVYQSFSKHFIDKTPWEDTEYYKLLKTTHLAKRVEEKGSIKELLKSYESLFQIMEKTGFQQLRPIVVHIGRNGEFIRHDGSHRLAIAKIIDLPMVPIRVKLIHKDAVNLAIEKGIIPAGKIIYHKD